MHFLAQLFPLTIKIRGKCSKIKKIFHFYQKKIVPGVYGLSIPEWKEYSMRKIQRKLLNESLEEFQKEIRMYILVDFEKGLLEEPRLKPLQQFRKELPKESGKKICEESRKVLLVESCKALLVESSKSILGTSEGTPEGILEATQKKLYEESRTKLLV